MKADVNETRSTCPYCGVGCGVIIESQGRQITGVRGDPDHPANVGRLCSKGSTLHHTATQAVTLQTRLLQPMRRAQRGAAPAPVSWDDALDDAAGRFARIAREHGPDALGFYISGQLLTEDYYVFNKLAKGLLGTNNVDTNSRLCMSSAVAGSRWAPTRRRPATTTSRMPTRCSSSAPTPPSRTRSCFAASRTRSEPGPR
jgi:assimilatory nitrate reductase catalytic subunit